MPRAALLASLLALIIPSAGLVAQAHPLAGAWELAMPVGARVENGVSSAIMGTGRLALQAVGDSLVGDLEVEPPAGYPKRPPVRLAARSTAGAVTFVVRSRAKVNVNGEESEREATSTYTFTAKGDELEGTVERTVEGMEAMGGASYALTGKRVRRAG